MNEMNDESLVRALYQAILQREPSPSETLHWVPDVQQQRYFEVINEFVTSEEGRAAAGRKLNLYVPPGHFYSPIVDTDELRRTPPVFADSANATMPALAIDGERMRAFWNDCAGLRAALPFPAEKREGLRYFYENESFSYGDAVVLYLMLRAHRPRRIIEVGSGYSTACMLDTIERHLAGQTALTCIEPYPERLLGLVEAQDRKAIRLIERPVQQVELSLFDQLEENDILFIDSTHVAKTGSDVCHEFFNILPFLNAGVLIHFHDVFYPFEYHRDWVYDQNRSWNELYLMRAFLMYNDAFEIVFFNHYFAQFFAADAATCPAFMKNPGGGLWLRKVTPALKRQSH
jgi:predicted O-methyltransferase YrrM